MMAYFGIYRGTVANNADPEKRQRMLLLCPSITGFRQTAWAERVKTPGIEAPLPNAGDPVWVMFEGGDTEYPVWLGMGNKTGAGTTVAGPVVLAGSLTAPTITGTAGVYDGAERVLTQSSAASSYVTLATTQTITGAKTFGGPLVAGSLFEGSVRVYSSNNPNLASTVSSSLTYAQAAAVGTGTTFARADHVHGTPATPANMVTTDTSQTITGNKTFRSTTVVTSFLSVGAEGGGISFGRTAIEGYVGTEGTLFNSSWTDRVVGDAALLSLEGKAVRIGPALPVGSPGPAPLSVTATSVASGGTLLEGANRVYSAANANLATAVVSGTAFGGAAAVGSGADYARGNHTHGTPATPVTTLTGTAGQIGVSASTGAVTLTNLGVTTVAGRAGAVVLTAADIGAGAFPASAAYSMTGQLWSNVTVPSTGTAGTISNWAYRVGTYGFLGSFEPASSTEAQFWASNIYYDGTSWRQAVAGTSGGALLRISNNSSNGLTYFNSAPVAAGAAATLTQRFNVDPAGNVLAPGTMTGTAGVFDGTYRVQPRGVATASPTGDPATTLITSANTFLLAGYYNLTGTNTNGPWGNADGRWWFLQVAGAHVYTNQWQRQIAYDMTGGTDVIYTRRLSDAGSGTIAYSPWVVLGQGSGMTVLGGINNVGAAASGSFNIVAPTTGIVMVTASGYTPSALSTAVAAINGVSIVVVKSGGNPSYSAPMGVAVFTGLTAGTTYAVTYTSGAGWTNLNYVVEG